MEDNLKARGGLQGWYKGILSRSCHYDRSVNILRTAKRGDHRQMRSSLVRSLKPEVGKYTGSSPAGERLVSENKAATWSYPTLAIVVTCGGHQQRTTHSVRYRYKAANNPLDTFYHLIPRSAWCTTFIPGACFPENPSLLFPYLSSFSSMQHYCTQNWGLS